MHVYFSTLQIKTLPHALAQFASHSHLETLSLYMDPHLVQEIPQSIPLFRNLKQLNMAVMNSDYGSEEDELLWVLSILKATPLLFKLELTVWGHEFYENQPKIRSLSGFSHDQLRQIKMYGFMGNCYEVEFAIYMLKSLTKLKLMVIDPSITFNGSREWTNHRPHPSRRERHKAIVQEKLEKVKTSARLIIL
ncbi:putative F-box domain, leucine-rich repeat domain, L domain-containing protein [Fagus crenata]